MKEETHLVDDLEKGSWPSFVKEMKRAGEKRESPRDVLDQLNLSYRDKITYSKHGGVVGIKGYGGGVIGRHSDSHGATGDAILLGTTTENLQPCFDELSEAGFDLDGSASVLRTSYSVYECDTIQP